MSDFAVTVTREIPVDRVRGLLCCALEGGSNYWYFDLEYRIPDGTTLDDFSPGGRLNPRHPEGPHHDWTRPYIIPFVEGGALIMGADDGEERVHVLDREVLAKGLQVMADKYPRHFSDFLDENDDADTGDCFLQCCLFGTMVFG